jgi:protein TonB
MFETALTSTAGRTRSFWSLPLAAAVHLAAGLLLIGASYLTLGLLPGPEFPEELVLYLSPAPPPPPAGPPAPRVPQTAPPEPREPEELTQPVSVPETLPEPGPALAPDEPPVEVGPFDGVGGPGGDGSGVPGSLGDGRGGGSILGPGGGGGPEHPSFTEPLEIGGAVRAPTLLRSVSPDYPHSARLARIQGPVRLRAVIDETGAIEDITVLEGNSLLVPAATEAVARWRYRPAMLDGRAVRVWVVVTVHFTLE